MGGDQGISDAEFGDWEVPSAVLYQASNGVGGIVNASREILRRISLGLIQARAKKTLVEFNGQISDLGQNRLIHPYITKFWAEYPRSQTLPLWQTSGAKVPLPSERSIHDPGPVHEMFGIRFSPSGVSDLLADVGVQQLYKPKATAEPTPTTEPPHAGGAPRAEHWDDLIIAIMLKMWDGDLQPANQEAVQKAILEWGVSKRINISESAAKTRARKLYKAYKSGVKN